MCVDAFVTMAESNDEVSIAIGREYALIYYKNKFLIWEMKKTWGMVDLVNEYDEELANDIIDIYLYAVEELEKGSNIRYWSKKINKQGRPSTTMKMLFNKAKEVRFARFSQQLV